MAGVAPSIQRGGLLLLRDHARHGVGSGPQLSLRSPLVVLLTCFKTQGGRVTDDQNGAASQELERWQAWAEEEDWADSLRVRRPVG